MTGLESSDGLYVMNIGRYLGNLGGIIRIFSWFSRQNKEFWRKLSGRSRFQEIESRQYKCFLKEYSIYTHGRYLN